MLLSGLGSDNLTLYRKFLAEKMGAMHDGGKHLVKFGFCVYWQDPKESEKGETM